MTISGAAGVVASYHGDATEISGHCYGAGPQVVLGLCLALLARLQRDGGRSGRTASG